ncbi:MAG TPA: cupin domain-containing protein [Devosiaceae bacterium]|jgi:uncharacterized protein YjlB|nr:cupin domain-containing protein [Devosiaceae bacterium]
MGSDAGLTAVTFGDDGTFPNSRLPLLLYAAALPPAEVSAEAMETLFAEAGWVPAWRYTVYPYHHYHSTAHEVLGIASGSARLQLGGPKGQTFEVAAGDVIVIPAGVVHKQLSKSEDFLVVGGYPPGQRPDQFRGEPGDRPQADENIARVPLPPSDPVTGSEPPLLEHWT